MDTAVWKDAQAHRYISTVHGSLEAGLCTSGGKTPLAAVGSRTWWLCFSQKFYTRVSLSPCTKWTGEYEWIFLPGTIFWLRECLRFRCRGVYRVYGTGGDFGGCRNLEGNRVGRESGGDSHK